MDAAIDPATRGARTRAGITKTEHRTKTKLRALLRASLVRDERLRPETDAQHPRERDEDEREANTEPEPIGDPSHDERHERSTHDAGAQDSGDRAVIFRDRVQREREDDRPHHRGDEA